METDFAQRGGREPVRLGSMDVSDRGVWADLCVGQDTLLYGDRLWAKRKKRRMGPSGVLVFTVDP